MSYGGQLLSIETCCECDVYQSTTGGSSPGGSSSSSASSNKARSSLKKNLSISKELSGQLEQQSYDGLHRRQLVSMLRDEKQKSLDQLAAFSQETSSLRMQIHTLKQQLENLHQALTNQNKPVQKAQKVSKKETNTSSATLSHLNSVSFSSNDPVTIWVGSPIKQQQQQQQHPSASSFSFSSCSSPSFASSPQERLSTCPAEFDASSHITQIPPQTKKLLGFLEDLVKKCSPSEMFAASDKPTERQIWKFIKNMTEEYVNMKKQAVQFETQNAQMLVVTKNLMEIFKTSSIAKAVSLARLQNEELLILRRNNKQNSGNLTNSVSSNNSSTHNQQQQQHHQHFSSETNIQ